MRVKKKRIFNKIKINIENTHFEFLKLEKIWEKLRIIFIKKKRINLLKID
jgi:hypothetical protein